MSVYDSIDELNMGNVAPQDTLHRLNKNGIFCATNLHLTEDGEAEAYCTQFTAKP